MTRARLGRHATPAEGQRRCQSGRHWGQKVL